jgi:tetratricopeptide (TPR) repeat protein
MVDIPEELARSIQAGDCILWAGAGLGSLAGRPGWEALLRRLVPECPEESREALEDLLEQGRLRTVLTYVHRHMGDEPLARLLKEVSSEAETSKLEAGASKLASLPWRACFATTYADVVERVFTEAGSRPDVIAHNTVHDLSLRVQPDFFILKTPPTGRNMRADRVLFDLVEEVIRTRTILFFGFEPDDPDLQQILALMDRIGRGNQHFALLPFVSAPEAEEWQDRFGIKVLHLPEESDLTAVVDDLAAAARKAAVRPSDVEGQMAVLDLTRAVRTVSMRADLALDDALTLDQGWISHLIERLPGDGGLGDVPAATLLRAGSVMLGHGNIDTARRCFQQVVNLGVEGEMMNIARFNLAMTFLLEGDREEALQGLTRASDADRSLAIVPPRFELVEILGIAGSQLFLTCRDRTNSEEVDIEVSTLGRPAGSEEQKQFTDAVHRLVDVEHPAVCKARGGFADGRLFGVMYQRSPGFILADTLRDAEPMTLPKAWEIVRPLLAGVKACHAAGLLHRNLTPHQILLAPDGAMLRGFGFPPVVGSTRPSVRRQGQGFMAPEVFGGEEITAAADVYALAAVLYRLLTGSVPLGSVPNPSSVMQEHDPRLGPLFRQALHPDPSKRASLDDLGEQLERIVNSPENATASAVDDVDVEPGQERVVDLGVSDDESQATPAIPTLARLKIPSDPDDLEGWAWVIDQKPTHAKAWEALERIEADAREAGKWDRVSDVLQVRVAHTQAQQQRAELLSEMARIYEDELGAPGSAFEAVRAMLDEVEGGQRLTMTEELYRLADATGRWSDLADALAAVAERTTDEGLQATLYTQLGGVFANKLGASEQAMAAYQKAVDLEPSVERYEAIVPLYRRAGNTAELATTLLSLADVQEGASRHDSLLGAARVLREELGDEEGALGVLEIVLAEAPEHDDALEAAESIARSLERWETLIDILGRRADLTLDPKEAGRLRREAAELAAEQKHDTSQAIEQLVRVTRADRSDREAATRLAELLRSAVKADPSRRATLIDTLSILVELADGSDEKAALLSESAELLDHEPDGKPRATECREQVMELLPTDHEVAAPVAVQLEKSYRRHDDYAALERMLLRQAEETDAEESFRADAWAKLLELRDGALEDEDGAVQALERLTELEPKNTKWRDTLLERYLAREEFAKAGPLIRAQVFDESDPKRKAELLELGGKLRRKIGKTEGALEALEEAVQLDPSRVGAWNELTEIYEENGQSVKATEAMISAAQNETNRIEKTKLLFEAAKRYQEELDNVERAAEIYEIVVELDPDHREATQALLEYLVNADQLERAWPHAQTYVMQVRSQAADDKTLNLRALSLAGRCALAVDAKDKARDYLQKAKALDVTNLDVTRLLAELDMDAGNWSDALKSYQSVALGAGEKLPAAERSQLHVQMAKARRGMKELPQALQMLDRALEVDGDNEVALKMMVEVAEEKGDFAAMARAKQMLAELVDRRAQRLSADASPEQYEELRARQAKLLSELAEIQHEKLKQHGEAVRTLEELLELEPDNPATLHKILDIFTVLERWRDCIEVLERLSSAQDNKQIQAKYLWAGGLVLRDNLQDSDAARDWFKRCLEADPTNQRAFEAYTEQLFKARSWNDMSRAIRIFMKALPKTTPPEQLANLFAMLGDTHERMRDAKTAIAAYDQSARMAAKAGLPDDVQRDHRERVIRLGIQLGEDEIDKAVHHAHALIANNPMEFEVYHRLVEIYLKAGSRDQAKTVARTLKFLRQADEAEIDLAGGAPSSARRGVARDKWRRGVYHPGEDPRLSDLFALVWPMVALREGRTHAHRGVERSQRVDVTLQSPTALARYVAHACQILDAPLPDLFIKDELGGIRVDALAEAGGGKQTVYPTVLAGRGATGEQSESSLAFRAGRAVSRARPEHILAAVLPSPASLRYVVYGAVKVAKPGFAVPEDTKSAAESYAQQIKPYLQAARLDHLRSLVEPYLEGAEPDLRAWAQGVAHTTTRAGFVLCDNLEVAAQIVTSEGSEGIAASAKERIADLVAYSVSEPYLKLRKQLGFGR